MVPLLSEQLERIYAVKRDRIVAALIGMLCR